MRILQALGKVIRESLLLLLSALSMLLVLLTLAGFWGETNWLLDLTNHFKPYYLIFQILLVLLFLLFKKRFWLCINFIFLFINASQIIPFYIDFRPTTALQSESIRLLQLNVCAPIKDYSRMTTEIKTKKPHIVTLEECADRCVNFLEKDDVLREYPYRIRKPEHRLLLLSQFPLQEKSLPLLHAKPAVIFAQLKAKQRIDLLMMHSTRPSSGAPYHHNQIIQFHQIARIIKQSKNPVIMVGDLNTTPWGYSLQQLLHESGLKNTMIGFGLQPSFPVFIPKMYWWTTPVVSIDHVLVSSQFATINRQNGKSTGSDHLPVVVDLIFSQQQEEK